MAVEETKTHDIGDTVIMRAEVRDRTEVLVDPDTIALNVRQPNGSVAAVVPAKIQTGIYEGKHDTALEGDHWFGYTVTGVGAEDDSGYGEQLFVVRQKRAA